LGSGFGIDFFRIDGDGTGFNGIDGGGTEEINFGFVSICLFYGFILITTDSRPIRVKYSGPMREEI